MAFPVIIALFTSRVSQFDRASKEEKETLPDRIRKRNKKPLSGNQNFLLPPPLSSLVEDDAGKDRRCRRRQQKSSSRSAAAAARFLPTQQHFCRRKLLGKRCCHRSQPMLLSRSQLARSRSPRVSLYFLPSASALSYEYSSRSRSSSPLKWNNRAATSQTTSP